MNTKILSMVFVAVLAVLSFSGVSAVVIDSTYGSGLGSINNLTVNLDGVEIQGAGDALYLATFAGETIPVKVYFSSNDTIKDVKVKVTLSGKTDSEDSFFMGNVVENDRLYRTGIMSLVVPKKLDDRSEELYLTVTVSSNGRILRSEEYKVYAQRNAYRLDIVSLDYDNSVSAGDTVPVSIVIKNRGFEDSEDGFVLVAIPDLGISSKAFFGDLVAIRNCSSGCDSDNTVQKVLNLKIPSSAKSGTYEIVAQVYDDETATIAKGNIKVGASDLSQVISSNKNQDLKAGETKTYELILVNSANKVAVYNLNVVSSSVLSVSAPSVVTVDAGSSKTVKIEVTASSDAEKGIYPFSVEANGQSVSFSANVVKSSSYADLSTIVLTVILVIVFIALLVALIVLLTKKEKPASEEVETSYY